MGDSCNEDRFVLVVDDDLFLLELISNHIRLSVEEVGMLDCAESGEDAIRKIREMEASNEVLSILVCDFMLSDMTATEVIRHARSCFPNCYVIILTGHSCGDPALNSVLDELNPGQFMTKPWKREDLVEAIQAALKLK